MTTRIIKDVQMNTSSSTLVPALGETWAHSANIRVVLSWKNTTRFASVVKCSYLPERPLPYIITVKLVLLPICKPLLTFSSSVSIKKRNKRC